MSRERNLFRAIVVSAVALVAPTAGCGDDAAPGDSGTARVDSGRRDGAVIADAGGSDAAARPDGGPVDGGEFDAGEDAMVLIL